MRRSVTLVGIIVSLIFVVVGNLWLSRSDETLDRIATNFGIKESPFWKPPIPNYEIPGYEENTIISITVTAFFTLFVLGTTLIV